MGQNINTEVMRISLYKSCTNVKSYTGHPTHTLTDLQCQTYKDTEQKSTFMTKVTVTSQNTFLSITQQFIWLILTQFPTNVEQEKWWHFISKRSKANFTKTPQCSARNVLGIIQVQAAWLVRRGGHSSSLFFSIGPIFSSDFGCLHMLWEEKRENLWSWKSKYIKLSVQE